MLFREDNVARADADAIRKGVGFYRWTHDIVEITGKDALEVLQKIYISNISKVAVGRSKYTASLDENGEIIDDVIVMHMEQLRGFEGEAAPTSMDHVCYRGLRSTKVQLIFRQKSSPMTGICMPYRDLIVSMR